MFYWQLFVSHDVRKANWVTGNCKITEEFNFIEDGQIHAFYNFTLLFMYISTDKYKTAVTAVR